MIFPFREVMCQVEVLQVHDEDQDRVDDRRNVEQGLDQDVTGDLSGLRISEELKSGLYLLKRAFSQYYPNWLKNNSLTSLV